MVYRGEKKLSYQRNRDGGTRYPATVTVPLESGSNRIAIVKGSVRGAACPLR